MQKVQKLGRRGSEPFNHGSENEGNEESPGGNSGPLDLKTRSNCDRTNQALAVWNTKTL